MSEENQWFIQIYQEHSARLFKQAFHVLRNQHLAEDLVEETFLILLYKQKDILNHPNIGGWLSQMQGIGELPMPCIFPAITQ